MLSEVENTMYRPTAQAEVIHGQSDLNVGPRGPRRPNRKGVGV